MLKTFSLHRQFKFHVILILNFISFYFMFFISKLKCFVLFLSENNIYYTKSMCLVCWQFLATRDKGLRPEFQGIYKKKDQVFSCERHFAAEDVEICTSGTNIL